MFSKTILSKIHKYSSENENSIKSSRKCGCFYCMKIFSREEINDWIVGKNAKTALCPYCCVDSVLCDFDTEITDKLLSEMNKYWF